MSLRDQTIRFRFQASSELPEIIDQLTEIRQLTAQNATVAKNAADALKTSYQQTTAAAKTAGQEQLVLTREIARQSTLEKQNELDTWLVQVKASEERLTTLTKSGERERQIIATEIAKQTTLEKQAELKRQETALNAALDAERKRLADALDKQLADYNAALRERDKAADAQRARDRADYEQSLQQQTNALKAETDQQTAIVRGEQQRQTALLRQEISQQNAAIRGQTDTIRNQTNAYKEAYSEVRNLIVAAFGVQEIFEFGKAVIDAKSKVDIFKVGLTQMVGSQVEAAQLFQQLTTMATKTPFEVENLMETTFRLKAVGVATKDLLPTLDMLGNMSAAIGTEKLPLIAKAFTDVQNKGKLMKQEINQFSENGVPLYDLMAESMGKTRDQVIAMAEAHTISFKDVKKALMDATSEGGRYYNLMGLQAETLGGQVSNLSDLWFVAKARLGDYAEKGLKVVVTGTQSLISVLAGSQSAIDRTTKLVQAGVLGYTSYVLYVSRAEIASKALATAQLLKNAAMGSGSLIMGTYNLTMITAAGSTEGFTAAQIRSATAARSTWAALASNPLVAVIAAVGLAVAAWKAYEAVSIDTTKAAGDQELALRTEQKTINDHVESVMRLEEGDKRRISSIQALINKYPDYFAGLSAEKTTNAQLKTILDTVNQSFARRIALAREAYNQQVVDEKLKGLFKTQDEIMRLAEERLGKDIMLKVNYDPAKLQAYLKTHEDDMEKFQGKVGGGWSTMFNQFSDTVNGSLTGSLRGGISSSLTLLNKGLADAEAFNARSIQQTQGLVAADVAWRVATEDKRHATVLEQQKAAIKANQDAAEDGDKKAIAAVQKAQAALQNEKKDHEDRLNAINQKGTEEEVKIKQGGADKTKQIAALSAAQIATITKEAHDGTVKEQIAHLNALEKAEIEAVNKRVVSKKASGEALKAIEEQVAKEVAAIHEKYEQQRQKVEYDAYKVRSSELDKFIKGNIEGITEIVTVDKDAVAVWKENQKKKAEAMQYVQQTNAETARIIIANEKETHQAYKQSIGLLFDMAGQMTGIGGTFAKAGKMVWENMDLLSGKTRSTLEGNVALAESSLNGVLAFADQSSAKGMKQVADATQNVAVAKGELTKFNAESITSMVGIASMAFQVLSAIADAWNESIRAQYEAIRDGMGRVQEIYAQFFDWYQQSNKEAYESDMKEFKGTYDEKIVKIRAHYKEQNELMAMRNGVDAELQHYKEMAEVSLAYRESVMKGMAAMAQLRTNDITRQKQQELEAIAVRRQQLKEEYEATIQMLDDKLAKAKETFDAEKDAAQDAFDKQKSLIEQERDDKIKAQNDKLDVIKDTYQKELEQAQKLCDLQKQAAKDRYETERAEVQATYDLKQSLLEQETSDEIEKMKILDDLRKAILIRYQADETEKLIATRDRILKTVHDEDDRKKVIQDFDLQIKQVNQEVQDAIVDKAKGVKLATEQLKKEEKETSERLKTEEKTALGKLEDDYEAKLKTAQENFDKWKDGQRELQKADEARIKGEIAKINEEADAKIKRSQEDLKATVERLQTELKNTQVDLLNQKKSAESSYNAETIELKRQEFEAQKAIVIAQLYGEASKLRASRGLFRNDNLEKAIIAIEDNARALEAKRFYRGTEYVDDPQQPDGIDTIPAQLTKGERVLTVEQNRAIGRISNEELVRRLTMPALEPISWADMSLPPFSGRSVVDAAASVDLAELAQEMKLTRQAVANLKQVNVSIDRNGFAVSEAGEGAIIEHWSNIFAR